MILGISNSKILKLYRLRKFNLLTTNLVILKFIKKLIKMKKRLLKALHLPRSQLIKMYQYHLKYLLI